MPDPISSLSQNDPANSCINDQQASAIPPAPPQTPVTPNQSLPSAAEEPGVCAGPTAVSALVAKFSAPPSVKSLVASAPPATTVTRPTLSVTTLTTSSGVTPGGGSYRVAASAVSAQLSAGPLSANVELGTASVQYGKNNDVQVALERQTQTLSYGGYSLSVVGDIASARANLGEDNDDGSVGGNIGAGVELIGGEATLNTPYGSLTGGMSASMSLSGSLGVRDADHDGKPEFCGKFSIPAYTLGACVEQFW